MRATFGGALLALAAIALGGCTAQGVQPVTGPSTATVSLASPTSVSTATEAVGRRKDDLVEAIERFKDQGCAYQRTGTSCSQDRDTIKRLVDMMRSDLDNATPWAAEVTSLARRTYSRLTAVSRLAEDKTHSSSMLDTELTALVQDLKSWSTVSD